MKKLSVINKPIKTSLPGVKRIFIKNLPYEATEQEIAGLFKADVVESVRIAHNNGVSKGFCYVEFYDRKEAIEALQDRT